MYALKILMLCALGNIIVSASPPPVGAMALPVDVKRNEYIGLARKLWNRVNQRQFSREAKSKEVCDSHHQFVRKNIHAVLVSHQYDFTKSKGWNLRQIDDNFEFYKSFISWKTENSAYLEIAETILRNDSSQNSIMQTLENIELAMINRTMYNQAMATSVDVCHKRQSVQLFLYTLYMDVALAQLKGHILLQFSWMMLSIYGKGDFSHEAQSILQRFEQNAERTLDLLREAMMLADREIWRCDPASHAKGKTYDEITRLLQGFVINEVDMNSDGSCREDCPYYISATTARCYMDLFCAHQPQCSGKLHDCTFVESNMQICPAYRGNTRRYDYIEYVDGPTYGHRSACGRKTISVDSWDRFLLWECSYCFCLCDESGVKSDRYFNLRESLSDVKNNRVVTGLRFAKRNRIFHLQVQDGELLPRGAINATSVRWKPIDNYYIFDSNVANGHDYHTLNYGSRAMDLDDIHPQSNSFILTGVRFRVVGTRLCLEAHFTEFNFEIGQLKRLDYWESKCNNTGRTFLSQKLKLNKPDRSSRSIVESLPNSSQNQWMEFVNTDMKKDAAQSTVPFIDIQDVVALPAVPLSGVGIFHKGRNGYGGFIAPKIFTYDYAKYV